MGSKHWLQAWLLQGGWGSLDLGIIFMLATAVIFLNSRNKEHHLVRKKKRIKIRQAGIFLSLSKSPNKKIGLQYLAGIFYFIL